MQLAEFEALLQNVDGVDAPTVDDLRYAFAPHGQSAVALSTNFIFIISHTLKGRTPQQVSELLEREKREYISPVVIRDYILNYVPPHLIHRHVALRALTKHQKIDELSVMEQLLALQYNRVAAVAEKDESDLEMKESSRREIDLCRGLAKDILDAKMKMGKIKGAVTHQVIQQDNRTQVSVISGQTNPDLDVRTAANVIKVLQEVEGAPKSIWDTAFAEIEQEEKVLHVGNNGTTHKDQGLVADVEFEGTGSGEGNNNGGVPGE